MEVVSELGGRVNPGMKCGRKTCRLIDGWELEAVVLLRAV